MLEHIFLKMSSGRWILTMTCALVFAYGAFNKIIPADAVVSIVSMVFISYFNRPDRKPNEGGK
jgi:hypothetical protein